MVDAAISLLTVIGINDHEFLEDHFSSNASKRIGLLHTIKQHIENCITDPALSTTTVSSYFGLSKRYIKKLFEADGTTLKAYITAIRLDRVRADICAHSLDHVPIGDIAIGCGFRDMTTFHRNFKNRFGDTPAQARVRAKLSASLRYLVEPAVSTQALKNTE